MIAITAITDTMRERIREEARRGVPEQRRERQDGMRRDAPREPDQAYDALGRPAAPEHTGGSC